jgi:LacI family transcriptional regulator
LTSVTIHHVARRAQVSIKTVSRVLNREPNVRADTRERVLAAAEALQYRPNQSARSLAGSRSFLICLFYDNPSPAYVSDVQLGAISRCREAGYHLIVEPIDSAAADLGRQVRATLSTLKVDGVILTPPVSDNIDVLSVLEESGTAYVRIAPQSDLDRAAYVYMDDRRAARDMTRLLIQAGHRDIGFIVGHPGHGASHLRRQGYVDALEEHGLELKPSHVVQGYFSFRSGFEAAEHLLSAPDRPSAIFASNDDMALGVIAVAGRVGLSVPQELSVVGFDDTPGAQIVWPQLTTVRQPIEEMAAAAADLLISGQARSGEARPGRLLEFEIIERDSASPLPPPAQLIS